MKRFRSIKGLNRPKSHKFHAREMVVDGRKFQSTLEGRRYIALRLMERAGAISDLRLQVPYFLSCNGIHICNYFADFVYLRNGVEVIEDAKGVITPEFRLKRKLMQAHGYTVTLWPERKK